MAVEEAVRAARVFVVVNSGSGNSAPDQVRATLSSRCAEAGSGCEFHDVAPGEDLDRIVRSAVEQGYDLVVAAGGDGTVSTVARALVGTKGRLGILPLGTTNVLARELGIPIDLDEACRLLNGPNRTVEIDAMRVGDAYYFTQIGIGVDALMIRDTTSASKKRFGSLAYLWTAAVQLAGFQPRRFSISADGRRERPRASQVMLINCGTLGKSGLRWTPAACVHDGRIEVCIVRARTVFHYMSVAWSVLRHKHHQEPNVRYLTAATTVAVSTDQPLPVQADGEVIGNTPIEVKVAPRALRVVVPVSADGG
jgi:diacylglycerol kinase (ATP)